MLSKYSLYGVLDKLFRIDPRFIGNVNEVPTLWGKKVIYDKILILKECYWSTHFVGY